jgi:hypothetical protein
MADQKIQLSLYPGEQQVMRFTTKIKNQPDGSAGLLYLTTFRIFWAKVGESPTIILKFSDITSTSHLSTFAHPKRPICKQ